MTIRTLFSRWMQKRSLNWQAVMFGDASIHDATCHGGSLLDSSLAPDGELYQVMIAPMVPFAARGLLWYQGEADNIHSICNMEAI